MKFRTSGFTLLEVIIAIGIFAFVSLFTAQSVQKALQNRTKVQNELENVGALRDALKVIESDVNKAFNYRDINIALYNETVKERNKKIQEARSKGAPGKPPPPPGPTPPPSPNPGPDPYAQMEELPLKNEVILTQFIGENSSVQFTSLANARVSTEERTSDQAEIGYTLEDCHSRRDAKRTTKCLVRRVSPILDKETEEGGEKTALLEDVTTLEFRYLGRTDPKAWVNTWYTNERGDDRSRNVFPYAVEVTIEVKNESDPKAKAVRMTMVAAIRNPNNPQPPPEKDAAGNPLGPPPPAPTQGPNPEPGPEGL